MKLTKMILLLIIQLFNTVVNRKSLLIFFTNKMLHYALAYNINMISFCHQTITFIIVNLYYVCFILKFHILEKTATN